MVPYSYRTAAAAKPPTVATYTYDAWGKITSSSGNLANTNPFRYRGYYYDTETGLYYLNSRYYDPVTGRFVNADGQLNEGMLGNNLYAYCENNPIMHVDPDGDVLQLASNATNAQKQDYSRAIAYLLTSAAAKSLINKLVTAKKTITIVFNSKDDDHYDSSTSRIYWDSKSGLVLKDKTSIQSAALGLAHEMGHAAQHLDGYLTKKTVAQIEANNLSTYETPIAKQLGEPTRSNYNDVFKTLKMGNSTDFGTLSYASRSGYINKNKWVYKPVALGSVQKNSFK